MVLTVGELEVQAMLMRGGPSKLVITGWVHPACRLKKNNEAPLGVEAGDVGDAADGGLASERGVGPVGVVPL